VADPHPKPDRSQSLQVGRSEIRPFKDFVDKGSTGSRDGDKIGFIPGGSYERGRYPALDKALDRLKKGPEPGTSRK